MNTRETWKNEIKDKFGDTLSYHKLFAINNVLSNFVIYEPSEVVCNMCQPSRGKTIVFNSDQIIEHTIREHMDKVYQRFYELVKSSIIRIDVNISQFQENYTSEMFLLFNHIIYQLCKIYNLETKIETSGLSRWNTENEWHYPRNRGETPTLKEIMEIAQNQHERIGVFIGLYNTPLDNILFPNSKNIDFFDNDVHKNSTIVEAMIPIINLKKDIETLCKKHNMSFKTTLHSIVPKEIISELSNNKTQTNFDELTLNAQKTIEGILKQPINEKRMEIKARPRTKMEIIVDLIKEESQKGSVDIVSIKKIKELAKENNIEEDFVDKAIKQLQSNGEIYYPRDGYVKLVCLHDYTRF